MRLLALCLLVMTPASVAFQQNSQPQDGLDSRKLDCSSIGNQKEGGPVFVGSMTGVRNGISTRKATVTAGEPVTIDLWVDNRSDEPAGTGGRCQPYLFEGDVFDSSGRRVIGILEQAKLDAEKRGGTVVEVCTSAEMLIQVPPHTCVGPRSAHGDAFTLDYKLQPGTYYVFPTRDTDPTIFKQGLMIKILEPK